MNNEPAFPTIEQNGDYDGKYWGTQAGLTKREWYAGMALQGLLASNKDLADAAALAWSFADRMISESQKPQQ